MTAVATNTNEAMAILTGSAFARTGGTAITLKKMRTASTEEMPYWNFFAKNIFIIIVVRLADARIRIILLMRCMTSYPKEGL